MVVVAVVGDETDPFLVVVDETDPFLVVVVLVVAIVVSSYPVEIVIELKIKHNWLIDK